MFLEYPKTAGIYKLTCLVNNKVYIGKTIDLKRRINDHKKSRIIPNRKFKIAYAIVKHGWESFVIEILETFEGFDKNNPDHNHKLLDKERKYIELLDTTDNEKGYNICKYSTDRTGHICSEESKKRMSEAQKRVIRIFDDERRQKLRDARLGKKMSEDAKDKIRQYRMGRKLSDESKNKLSVHRKGKKMSHIVSEETREKMSKSRLGRPCSEETKQKISMKNKGKKRTSEMNNLRRGVPCSEETKEKIRQSRRKNMEDAK
jgi:group I intron endonuclease